MKAKKIYNAPKCKAIEMDTEALLMQSGPNRGETRMLNRTQSFSQEEEGDW